MDNNNSNNNYNNNSGSVKDKLKNFPHDLKKLRQWVNYRIEERDGTFTKIPFQIDGIPASSTDVETWNDFVNVFKAYQSDSFDGIGFVVTPTDKYCGIDLDHCRNAETGEIEPDKLAIIKQLNSYTEITPSNTGLRVWIKAKIPGDRKRNDKLHIEIYDSARFFTVTGNHLEGTPTTIENRQDELNKVYSSIFPDDKPAEKPKPTTPVNLDDTDLIDKAKNAKNGNSFIKLWNGDISEHDNDDSRADLALCSMLAFWTGNDLSRIDRMFRQSGLYREKWERQDYRERTIKLATSGNRDIYVNNNTYLFNNDTSFAKNETKTGQKRDKNGTFPGQKTDDKNNQNLSARLDEVLREAGRMSKRDISGTIPVQTTDDSFRKWVQRRTKDGQIRFYRGSSEILEWVNRDYKVLSLADYRKQANLKITLPLGLNHLVYVPPGSVIAVAGFTSAGKTALLLEICELNIVNQNLPVYYWFNEMSEDRMLLRLEDYPNLIKEMGKQFKAVKQTDFEFYDVTEPDAINVIDYLDLDGEGEQAVYMIGAVIKKLQQRLGKGIVFFGLQKKDKSDFGYGGVFSAKLSNLYLSLDVISQNENSMVGKCKIVKAKDWGNINPVNLYTSYYTAGKHGRLYSDNIWKRNESDIGSTFEHNHPQTGNDFQEHFSCKPPCNKCDDWYILVDGKYQCTNPEVRK